MASAPAGAAGSTVKNLLAAARRVTAFAPPIAIVHVQGRAASFAVEAVRPHQ